MIFNINGVDYSTYINKRTNIVETPRYIDGVNTGTSINGTAIYDRVATKYDVSFQLNPLTDTQMNTIATLLENETVTLEYSSFKGTRTITAQPKMSSVKFFKDNGTNKIYAEVEMTFEEK